MDEQAGQINVARSLLALVITLMIFLPAWQLYSKYRSSRPEDVPAAGNTLESASAADAITWERLDPDLQTAILGSWKADAPVCLESRNNPTISDTLSYHVIAGQFALIPVGCSDIKTHLFVHKDRAWKDIAYTKSTFSCSTLTQYQVPKEFMLSNGFATCLLDDKSMKNL
jgi:hypothetical protein